MDIAGNAMIILINRFSLDQSERNSFIFTVQSFNGTSLKKVVLVCDLFVGFQE